MDQRDGKSLYTCNMVDIFGLTEDVTVIWLLSFGMKRNCFTIFILNLAVADLGFLSSYFFLMYITGLFLLTAISTERCVSVLFPIWCVVVFFPLWHRFDRGPNSSTIICAIIWIFSFLLSAIHFALRMTGRFGASLLHYQLLVNALLCTPLMFISSLILFIKICCKAQQRKQGKLTTAILLALLFFLIFAFPLNAVYVSYCYYFPHLHSLMLIGFGCSSVNSSINPIIYFLVGRRGRKSPSRVSMRAAISRVFKDVGDCTEDKKSRTESKVMI
uniref:G-protein coupled receptors family 1 profile domain-containing protein n=1 Tax=Podarcis muralis TaxID=64176 RepID=A0A670IG47_PODMU